MKSNANMNKTLISVIMPFHNTEKYIKEAIQSVQLQEHTEFELICIDDRSTDKSAEIVKEIAAEDRRIILGASEGKGAGEARNLGIELSHGDYIAFLDSDDMLEKNALSEMLKLACEEDVDLVICGNTRMSEEGQEIPTKPWTPRYADSRRKIRKDILGVRMIVDTRPFVWGKLFKRQQISKSKFPCISDHEDTPFATEAVLAARTLAFHELPLWRIRVNRPGSLQTEEQTSEGVLSACHLIAQYCDRETSAVAKDAGALFCIGEAMASLRKTESKETAERLWHWLFDELLENLPIKTVFAKELSKTHRLNIRLMQKTDFETYWTICGPRREKNNETMLVKGAREAKHLVGLSLCCIPLIKTLSCRG